MFTRRIKIMSTFLFLCIIVQVMDNVQSHQHPINVRNRSRSTSFSQQQQQLPRIPSSGRRSACRFFVWDAISAFRYKLCNRLLRDNVYEGLGGKKFVRIKPGSILESLYPPSKHGPDKCLLCGMSFRDHLTCWWYPHLYSSYDRYLDEIRKNGTMISSSSSSTSSQALGCGSTKITKHRGKNHHYHNDNHAIDDYEHRYIYHQQYVKDISSTTAPTTSGKGKARPSTTKKKYEGQQNIHAVEDSPSSSSSSPIEHRKIAGVTFVLPKMKNVQERDSKSSTSTRRNKNSFDKSILVVARNLVLAKLEELLWIQKYEQSQQ